MQGVLGNVNKVRGIGLLYNNTVLDEINSKFLTHNRFFLIFTRAIALVNIRRKMVIREKSFVNFTQNRVIIDTKFLLLLQ